jgi:hypothetical protein
MANKKKRYKIKYYKSVNGCAYVEIVTARNLSEARELVQVQGAIYIQYAYTFQYTELPY